jgi:hypothetical protein
MHAGAFHSPHVSDGISQKYGCDNRDYSFDCRSLFYCTETARARGSYPTNSGQRAGPDAWRLCDFLLPAAKATDITFLCDLQNSSSIACKRIILAAFPPQPSSIRRGPHCPRGFVTAIITQFDFAKIFFDFTKYGLTNLCVYAIIYPSQRTDGKNPSQHCTLKIEYDSLFQAAKVCENHAVRIKKGIV